MGRFRPPQPKGSPYITPQGYEGLQKESESIWKKRREVTAALAAAAAEGDRSENAEYIYRKKELRELDRRIRYLQKRLPELKIIDQIPPDTSQIFFGAWVTLQEKNGDECRYRVVGADELDTQKGWISVDAPLAQALLKKFCGESVSVHTPAGLCRYQIVAVDYHQQ